MTSKHGSTSGMQITLIQECHLSMSQLTSDWLHIPNIFLISERMSIPDDDTERTPIMHASKQGPSKTAEVLIEHHAILNTTDSSSMTPVL